MYVCYTPIIGVRELSQSQVCGSLKYKGALRLVAFAMMANSDETTPPLNNRSDELGFVEDRLCEFQERVEEFPDVGDTSLCDRSLISAGRFGEIYRVVNTLSGSIYALKRLRIAFLAPRVVTVAILAHEYKTLQALSISHITRYIAFSLSNDECFFNISMELVEGGPLAEKITCTPAPEEAEVRKWLRQMAMALSYIHGKDVLHRNLKPENVMLTRTSEVKLVGLELPCVAAITTDFTVYTSFERVMDLRYDGRDDAWAAGCILLEMLSRSR
jgi:serine/threonine protein kinase